MPAWRNGSATDFVGQFNGKTTESQVQDLKIEKIYKFESYIDVQ